MSSGRLPSANEESPSAKSLMDAFAISYRKEIRQVPPNSSAERRHGRQSERFRPDAVNTESVSRPRGVVPESGPSPGDRPPGNRRSSAIMDLVKDLPATPDVHAPKISRKPTVSRAQTVSPPPTRASPVEQITKILQGFGAVGEPTPSSSKKDEVVVHPLPPSKLIADSLQGMLSRLPTRDPPLQPVPPIDLIAKTIDGMVREIPIRNMPLFQRLLDSIEKQDEVNFWRCYDGTVRSGDARALELKTQRRILELFKAGKIVNRKKEATKIKLLDQLWATAQISHERPDAALYQDFIELYALVGSLAGVEKGIAALERTGAPVQSRGVQQWNMVALIRAGKVVEARNIYDEYRLETGDSPKLANKFFRACGHADQETAMLDLFKDLEQYGPAPDSHSYSFVITYYSVRGRMDEAAVWLKKLSSRLFNRPPVTQVFNMVLAGYIRTVQPEPANALLVEMAAAGVAHDWNTNEHVIGIAAIEGDSTRAWRAYASSTNPNPSHVTLEYLARLTGPVTDDDASLDAFRAALAEAGVELTPVILAKLVKGYKQLPDGNSAEAVLEWSHRLGYSVKEHTYNDVLAAHINAGDLASGERFADAMSKAGVPVTEAVWRRLIWSLKEAGQSEDALRVLEDGHERYPFMPRAFVAELQQRFGRKDPLAVRASEVMGDKMAFRSQKPLDH